MAMSTAPEFGASAPSSPAPVSTRGGRGGLSGRAEVVLRRREDAPHPLPKSDIGAVYARDERAVWKRF